MTEYLIKNDPAACYGCRGCEQICPQGAIRMQPNEEGFLYPVLDEALCVRCGRCAQACPHTERPRTNLPQTAYAFAYDDARAVRSTSGGAFLALADWILGQGGCVCGCVLDEQMRAVHMVSDQPQMLARMQGSKYVQSDMGAVYSQIKERLAEQRPVLFTGTPCQVAGLYAFLGGDHACLYTVDLVCHGTPSPALLDAYLKEQAARYGSIKELQFRDQQRQGWGNAGTLVVERGGKERARRISPGNDTYYHLFETTNSVLRMSCYSCPWAARERVGDITLGDFWGIREELPQLAHEGGVSLVLPNTEKGARLFDLLEGAAVRTALPYEAAVKYNGHLRRPQAMPPARADIYRRIREQGYAAVARHDCKFHPIRARISRLIPHRLRQLVRRVLKGT